jgi:hypothetical protein
MIEVIAATDLKQYLEERGYEQGKVARYESSITHDVAEQLMRGRSNERIWPGYEDWDMEGVKVNEVELNFQPWEFTTQYINLNGSERVLYEFFISENPDIQDYMHPFIITKKETVDKKYIKGTKSGGKFVGESFIAHPPLGESSSAQIPGDRVYTDIHVIGNVLIDPFIGTGIGNGPRFRAGLTKEDYKNKILEKLAKHKEKFHGTGKGKNIVDVLIGVREGFAVEPVF